jgi:hypothetical protein
MKLIVKEFSRGDNSSEKGLKLMGNSIAEIDPLPVLLHQLSPRL